MQHAIARKSRVGPCAKCCLVGFSGSLANAARAILFAGTCDCFLNFGQYLVGPNWRIERSRNSVLEKFWNLASDNEHGGRDRHRKECRSGRVELLGKSATPRRSFAAIHAPMTVEHGYRYIGATTNEITGSSISLSLRGSLSNRLNREALVASFVATTEAC